MTTLTYHTQENLTDGTHYFSSNLYLDNQVVRIGSSVRLENGIFTYCECIACETQSFKRDDEYNIRKAITFLLNEDASKSLVLDCGITVFKPLVFVKYS